MFAVSFSFSLRNMSTYFFALIVVLSQAVTAAPLHPSLWEPGQPHTDSHTADLRDRYNRAPQFASSPIPSPDPALYSPVRTTGEISVVVIPVGFSDKQLTESQREGLITRLFCGDSNSAYSYFAEASHGHMSFLEGTTSVVVQSTHEAIYYGADGSDIDNANVPIWRLAEEAVKLADVDGLDLFRDFSTRKINGRWIVDHVIVVHSHGAQELDGKSGNIWSHRWYIGGSSTNHSGWYQTTSIHPEDDEPIYVRNYAMFSIDSPVGIIAHEFGHELGLPDLYNTDNPTDVGVGDWCIMSTGCWLGGGNKRDGTSPAHFSPWCKKELGWITYEDITGNNNGGTAFSVAGYDNTGTTYQIRLGSDHEYLAITNRRRNGYDSHVPGEGLLIWHIDESQTDNNKTYRRLAHVVQAGGGSVYSRGASTDPFHAGDQFEFTPDSSPPAVSYCRNHVAHIDEISTIGDVMTFRNRLAFYIGVYNNPADADEIVINVKPNYPVSDLSDITVIAREGDDTEEVSMNRVSGGTILLGSYRPAGSGAVNIEVSDTNKDISDESGTVSSTSPVATLLFTAQRPLQAAGGIVLSPCANMTLDITGMHKAANQLITILPAQAEGAGELIPAGRSYVVRGSNTGELSGAYVSYDDGRETGTRGLYYLENGSWKWAVPVGRDSRIPARPGQWAVMSDNTAPELEADWEEHILVVTASDHGSGLVDEPVVTDGSVEIRPFDRGGDRYYFDLTHRGSGHLASIGKHFTAYIGGRTVASGENSSDIFVSVQDRAGNMSTVSVRAPDRAPPEFVRLSVAPNPAVDEVVFRYRTSGSADRVTLVLRDTAGALVARFNEYNASDGDFFWDLHNQRGRRVANGVYLWEMEISDSTGSRQQSGKVAVIQ